MKTGAVKLQKSIYAICTDIKILYKIYLLERYNAYVYRVSNHKEAVRSWMPHVLGCGVLVFETWGQSLGLAVPYALSHRSVPGPSVRKLWYVPFGRPTKTPSTNILSNLSETALHL